MGANIKNIRNTATIPPQCRERFLNLKAPCGRALRERGAILSGISDLSFAYEIGRTDPSFHLLLCTLGGAGRLRTLEGERMLSPGDRLLAPAGTPYGYALAAARWRILWFHLADSEAWRPLHQRGLSVRPSAALPRLESATEGYLAESARTEPGSQKAARLFAELIGVYLDRELEAEGDPRAREIRNRLYALWDLVDGSLQRDWQVADLAAETHMSPVNFHRVCAKYAGVRPMEMVTRLRMQRAEDLLRTTDYKARQIAELVGYENPFAFSVAFKRHAGKGPREFRRACSPAQAR